MPGIAYELAVKAFYAVDGAFLSRLSPRSRKAAFGLAVALKDRLFPGGTVWGDEETRLLRRVPRAEAAQSLPDWLLDEIGALSREVDPLLYRKRLPSAGNYQQAWPFDPAPAEALRRMQTISPSPRYVMIVPWVKRGGADLVILKHLAEFAALGPTCLITTEPSRSEWLDLVPVGVQVIEAAGILSGLSRPMDRRIVLARYLMQCGAATVHLVNSMLGWETFRDYGKAISQTSRLFASVYCDDTVHEDGSYSGYAHDFLPGCCDFLDGVISDNRTYLDRLTYLYGLDRAKMSDVYVWTDSAEPTPPAPGGRVMWAGRLDRQKRPDILLGVAEACPEIGFDVYGSTMLAHDRSILKRLSGLPNVRMMGAYDGFPSIDTGKYRVLLYTSGWDGLPNVLLEAGMRGMCIVASSVGGIGELIDETTGWPVLGDGGWQQHADAVRRAMADPQESAIRASRLRDVVTSRHSRSMFAGRLRLIPGYF